MKTSPDSISAAESAGHHREVTREQREHTWGHERDDPGAEGDQHLDQERCRSDVLEHSRDVPMRRLPTLGPCLRCPPPARPLAPGRPVLGLDRRFVFVMWTAGLGSGARPVAGGQQTPFTREGLGLTEGEMSLLLGIARLAASPPCPWVGWRPSGTATSLLIAISLVVAGVSSPALPSRPAVRRRPGRPPHRDRRHVGPSRGPARRAGEPAIRADAISFFGTAVSLGAGLALMTFPSPMAVARAGGSPTSSSPWAPW